LYFSGVESLAISSFLVFLSPPTLVVRFCRKISEAGGAHAGTLFGMICLARGGIFKVEIIREVRYGHFV
jgi:hypothetical protein